MIESEFKVERDLVEMLSAADSKFVKPVIDTPWLVLALPTCNAYRAGYWHHLPYAVMLIPVCLIMGLFFLDVITRERWKTALHDSDTRFKTLVENMNEGVGVLDEFGAFTYVNNKLCEIFGYSPNEMVGRSSLDLFGGDQKRWDELMVARRDRHTDRYETESQSSDKSKIPILVDPQVILDENGRFRGSFAVIMDITERTLAEKALCKSNEELRC